MKRYREAVEGALAGGWRFGGLHASERGRVVRVLLVAHDGAIRLESVDAAGGEVPSLVDLAPAAGWDEREAHDLDGVRFAGHEPLRPLADHVAETKAWAVPVRGHDPYQVAVGPIHAGVIESGHFRFHVVGDRILHVDVRLFYKHRGLEHAAEGRTLEEGTAYVARACAACSVANGIAYALACEQALGLAPSSELARVRGFLLELERMWSHLNDVAAVCAGVGLAAGTAHFQALTERARRLNATLAGHRFLAGSVRVGGSALDVPAHALRTAGRELDDLREQFEEGWRALLFNFSFQDRLGEVGVLDAHTARLLGATGPAARAAGIAEDVRAASGLVPAVPERPGGDVRARLEQRALELRQSLDLLAALSTRPFRPTAAVPRDGGADVGVGRVESARGATACVVERRGDRIQRLRLRTGSYANWPSVAEAAVGDLLPDFPLVNKSFELCYACADR